MSRQCSAHSISSASSASAEESNLGKESKKKTPRHKSQLNVNGHSSSSGWLRNSFTRAFKKSKTANNKGSVSDAEANVDSRDSSFPNSPISSVKSNNSTKHYDEECPGDSDVVKELKRHLREKDMQLTDLRLESLSSAYQLENLKSAISRMKLEILTLKQDNDSLQKIISAKSHGPSLAASRRRVCKKRISANSHNSFYNSL